MIITILYIILIIVFLLLIIKIIINNKISILENEISVLFSKRLAIIPGFFEISRKNTVKHSNVFYESLKLFKLESTIYKNDVSFYNRLHNISLLDHELEFLFKVFNRNPSFINTSKYLYLKDITINNGIEIGLFIQKYEKTITIYNFLVYINNLLLIGYILPFNNLK